MLAGSGASWDWALLGLWIIPAGLPPGDPSCEPSGVPSIRPKYWAGEDLRVRSRGPDRTQPHPTTAPRRRIDLTDGSGGRLAATYVVRRDTESGGTLRP